MEETEQQLDDFEAMTTATTNEQPLVIDYDYSDFEDSKTTTAADDDDEDVNVIIDTGSIEEEQRRLQQLLSMNHRAVAVASSNDLDVELKNEIRRLVALSISPSTDKSITVLVNNQLILVPVTVKLSDRLVSHIWPAERVYVESKLPFQDEFNNLLIPNVKRHGDTFGIFSVKYNKTQYLRNYGGGGGGHSGGLKECSSGLYQYCDFAAIIVSNNRVIDYAVHGHRSNINRMFERHRPRRIYYNARLNDALYVFVNYKYQPFYESLKDVSRPVQIHRNVGGKPFNTLPFCDRKDAFCALCCGLRDTRGFINDSDVPMSLKIPQSLRNFHILRPFDPTASNNDEQRRVVARRVARRYNPYRQPDHNSRRLPLNFIKRKNKYSASMLKIDK